MKTLCHADLEASQQENQTGPVFSQQWQEAEQFVIKILYSLLFTNSSSMLTCKLMFACLSHVRITQR